MRLLFVLTVITGCLGCCRPPFQTNCELIAQIPIDSPTLANTNDSPSREPQFDEDTLCQRPSKNNPRIINSRFQVCPQSRRLQCQEKTTILSEIKPQVVKTVFRIFRQKFIKDTIEDKDLIIPNFERKTCLSLYQVCFFHVS